MSQTWRVNEENSYIVTFNLVDENNDPITLPSLGTLILTNYYYSPDLPDSDKYHLATINGRHQQNVLNLNNVSVSSSGTVQWVMQKEDNQKLNVNIQEETHIALFSFDYNSRQNSEAIIFKVRKIDYITES